MIFLRYILGLLLSTAGISGWVIAASQTHVTGGAICMPWWAMAAWPAGLIAGVAGVAVSVEAGAEADSLRAKRKVRS